MYLFLFQNALNIDAFFVFCGSSPTLMNSKLFSQTIIDLEDPKSEPHPINHIEGLNEVEYMCNIQLHLRPIQDNLFITSEPEQECLISEEEDDSYSVLNSDPVESSDYDYYYEYYDNSDDDSLNVLEVADNFVQSKRFDVAHLLYIYLLSKNEPVYTSAMILDFRCLIYEKGEFNAFEEIKQRTEFFSAKFIKTAMSLCLSSEIISYFGILGIERFHDIEIFSFLHDYYINNHDLINALQLTYQYHHIFPLKCEQQIVTQKRLETEYYLSMTQFQHNRQYKSFIEKYSYKNLKPLSTEEQLAVDYLNSHSGTTKNVNSNCKKNIIMKQELDSFLNEISDYHAVHDDLITVDMVIDEIMNCKL